MQVEQYQNFNISYEGEDFFVPGAQAAGENIADNGETKAAYEAYERLPEAEKQYVPGFNFTSDQLFWVKYAFKRLKSNFLASNLHSLATRSSGAH